MSGQRGEDITTAVLLKMPDVEVAAVCDEYPVRVEKVLNEVETVSGKRPVGVTDYREYWIKSILPDF